MAVIVLTDHDEIKWGIFVEYFFTCIPYYTVFVLTSKPFGIIVSVEKN
jgi:hypothetical protein